MRPAAFELPSRTLPSERERGFKSRPEPFASKPAVIVGVSQNYGYLFRGRHNYNMLGYMRGTLILGNYHLIHF